MSAVSAGCALGWAVLFCCEIQYGASDQVRSDYSIVSRDFRLFFWVKILYLGPKWTGKNSFAKYFVSVVCPCTVQSSLTKLTPGNYSTFEKERKMRSKISWNCLFNLFVSNYIFNFLCFFYITVAEKGCLDECLKKKVVKWIERL